MTTLLHIDSSGKGENSLTKELTKYFVESWVRENRDGKIIERDLLKSDLKFVDEQTIGAFFTAESEQSDAQKKLLETSNSLIQELQTADVWIFGVPMYNFGPPAVFKAYIDLIARAGKTFSFADGTPRGLLTGKKVYVAIGTGSDYSSEPYKSLDFVEPYVRGLFGFLGATDITFFRAHGHDPATIAKTTGEAKQAIEQAVKQKAAV